MSRLLALFLISLSLGAQSATQTAVPGSVSGRVTDSQTAIGIGGAVLHLFPRSNPSNTQSTAPSSTSLDDGTFHFDSVSPGAYILWATHPNYVSNAGASQRITVEAGQSVSNISVPLQSLGSISGRVLDQAGNPVAKARMQLLTTFNLRGRLQPRRTQSSNSDASGKFLFEKVAPGRYYLRADPPGSTKGSGKAPDSDDTAKNRQSVESPEAVASGSAESLIPTFYPKALTFEDAGAIDVAPAASISEADIRLQRAPTFHVRGKIESLGPGVLRKGGNVILEPRDTQAMNGLGRIAHAEPDGSFDIPEVPSGSYTLWLLGSYRSDFDQSRRGGRRRTLARQDVDVSGADTNSVLLSLLPPVNLVGRVTLVDPPPNANPSQLRVVLQPAGPSVPGSYQNVAVNANGAFGIQDLDPGEYMVRVINAPAGAYVESITLNRQDVMTNGMDLSQGGGGELQITLHGGAAEIDGTLSVDGQTSQSAYGTVLLVPEALPVDGSGVLSASVKAGGVFTIANVPPGRYFAFATEHWANIWQNVDFLHFIERRGVAVDLQQNGHAQIQLSLLSADQLQQAALQLGLTVQ